MIKCYLNKPQITEIRTPEGHISKHIFAVKPQAAGCCSDLLAVILVLEAIKIEVYITRSGQILTYKG